MQTQDKTKLKASFIKNGEIRLTQKNKKQNKAKKLENQKTDKQ